MTRNEARRGEARRGEAYLLVVLHEANQYKQMEMIIDKNQMITFSHVFDIFFLDPTDVMLT
jgi:hypothetical protein